MGNEYFAIGKISAMFGISVQTLRYYDKIGLLTPDYINESSGYRYYGIDKIRDLEHIFFFRQLGLPLAEVGEALTLLKSGAMRFEQLLDMERAKLTAKIDTLESQRKRIDRCLDYCSHPLPRTMEVHIKEFEARRYRYVSIAPVSLTSDHYHEATISARLALIGTEPGSQCTELGEMGPVSAFRDRGVIELDRLICGPAGEKDLDACVVPQGVYACLAFRRSESSEQAAAAALRRYVSAHRFGEGESLLFLSRDLMFMGPTGRGDLSEVQLLIKT